MAGKDINTWKMKRKDKYERPMAVRMQERDLAGVSGGQDTDQGSAFTKGCSGGAFASVHCSGGSGAFTGTCGSGGRAGHGCKTGNLG